MSYYIHSRLIPVRFLTMIGHLVMLVMAFSCRELSVKSCLSYDYDMEQFTRKDNELAIGLLLSIGLIAIEMISFVFGILMFESLISVMSIATHAMACIFLSYWLADSWDCTLFWIVFIFCSLIPGCIEVAVIINMMIVKRICC